MRFDIHFDVGDDQDDGRPARRSRSTNKGAIEHTFKIEDTDFELKAEARQDARPAP